MIHISRADKYTTLNTSTKTPLEFATAKGKIFEAF